MLFDYACIGASMYALYYLKSSGIYDELPLVGQCAVRLEADALEGERSRARVRARKGERQR
jgi:hypothetical protein